MTDKIPIGRISFVGPDYYQVMIRTKDINIKRNTGEIITLDMIEPYESLAVRKVTEYLLETFSVSIKSAPLYAKEIVDLVHDAEDADE